MLTQHLFETGPSDGVTASGVTEQVPPTVDAAIVPVGGDRERGGAGTCGEYDSCVLGQRAAMGQHGVTRHQHGRAGVLALQPVQQFDTPVWRTRHAGKTDSDGADITERAPCLQSVEGFLRTGHSLVDAVRIGDAHGTRTLRHTDVNTVAPERNPASGLSEVEGEDAVHHVKPVADAWDTWSPGAFVHNSETESSRPGESCSGEDRRHPQNWRAATSTRSTRVNASAGLRPIPVRRVRSSLPGSGWATP
ncbi:hypothetical protein GCM10027599_21400 [Yimella radicis]